MRKNDSCTRSTLKHLSLVLALTLMFSGLPVEALASVELEAESLNKAECLADETVGEITAEISEAETEEVITPDEFITDPDTYGENTGVIEINQCFSYHTGRNDGVEKLIDEFVARKKTAVMMKIPGSDKKGYTKEQAEKELDSYSVEVYAVRNGVESSNPELFAEGAEAFSAKIAFDINCEKDGYYAVTVFDNGPNPGTYNFHWYKDGSKVAERKAAFFETNPLNILIVPVKAY